MHDLHDHLTLTEATKVAPGRPSTNCLWRWCRRGVLARSGERVHLQHSRVGGKLYTTAAWLREFGERLARADATYFDLEDEQPVDAPSRGRRGKFDGCQSERRLRELEDVNRELDEAGL